MTDYNIAGRNYLVAPDLSHLPKYRTAGFVLATFFHEKYSDILDELEVEFVDDAEPYPDTEHMLYDIAAHRYMKVAATIPGTTPLWDAHANNAMRVWHDYGHHFELNLGFGIEDEAKAFQAGAIEFVEWAQLNDHAASIDAGIDVLYSEMVLQPAAAIWLGGYDSTRDGLTFQQKIVRL